jgi:hypothetical protein
MCYDNRLKWLHFFFFYLAISFSYDSGLMTPTYVTYCPCDTIVLVTAIVLVTWTTQCESL